MSDSLSPEPVAPVAPPLPAAPSVPSLPVAVRETTLVQAFAERVREEMGKTLVGQNELIDMLLTAILSEGHILLEGVPGTAKTLAIRTLAAIFDAPFARIQFTPDLMPSDITGTNVFDPRAGEFNLKKGPLFAGLVLADEVNRTPPKTQSALLEAMEERQVTIDGASHPLPSPFLVCATQNPIEYEGTYPLPEAQLDRFMLKIVLSYPQEEEERAILSRVQGGFRSRNIATANVAPLLNQGNIAEYQAEIEKVQATPEIQRYIVQIVRATRNHKHLALGASPRASINLLLASKTYAAMQGRAFVTPDEVKRLAPPILRHRLLIRPESEIEGYTPDRVIEGILGSLEVPR